MKLQPGDYIALEGLTDQQIDAVIERMEDAGGIFHSQERRNFILLDYDGFISYVSDFKNLINDGLYRQLTIEQVLGVQPSNDKNSKYDVEVKGATLDVYDVLKAWNVTNPALQHLIKKALQAGNRGHKTLDQDMDDIVASAIRARELAK